MAFFSKIVTHLFITDKITKKINDKINSKFLNSKFQFLPYLEFGILLLEFYFWNFKIVSLSKNYSDE
jgi:hypothetical protein